MTKSSSNSSAVNHSTANHSAANHSAANHSARTYLPLTTESALGKESSTHFVYKKQGVWTRLQSQINSQINSAWLRLANRGGDLQDPRVPDREILEMESGELIAPSEASPAHSRYKAGKPSNTRGSGSR